MVRVYGLGFTVYGLGFRVYGLGFLVLRLLTFTIRVATCFICRSLHPSNIKLSFSTSIAIRLDAWSSGDSLRFSSPCLLAALCRSQRFALVGGNAWI